MPETVFASFFWEMYSNTYQIEIFFVPPGLPAFPFTGRLSPRWAPNAFLANVVTALRRKVIQA